MTLYRKIQAVERVFKGLEKDVAAFKHVTKLECLVGCGKCCSKPDISASPLEFLPFAYHLYKRGLALEYLDRIKDHPNSNCIVLSPLLIPDKPGFCSEYPYRGLICRLFGFSAALNKYGNPELVTCKSIKETYPNAVEKAKSHIMEGKDTPIMRHYYFKLQSIDGNLCSKLMPINKAIEEALKIVLSYYAYRRPRSA